MTMVTRTPGRRERSKSELRSRILGAALELFTRRGFENTTIDEIAFAADVGKGTVYNYFRTKEEIVVGFFIDIERRSQDELSKLARSRKALADVLVELILIHFRTKQNYHPFVRVFLAELSGRATGETPWIQEVQTVLDPPLNRIFGALQKRGLLRADIPMPALIGAFKVMHLGLTVLWAIEGPPWSSIPHIVRSQIRLFCSGIGVKP